MEKRNTQTYWIKQQVNLRRELKHLAPSRIHFFVERNMNKYLYLNIFIKSFKSKEKVYIKDTLLFHRNNNQKYTYLCEKWLVNHGWSLSGTLQSLNLNVIENIWEKFSTRMI